MATVDSKGRQTYIKCWMYLKLQCFRFSDRYVIMLTPMFTDDEGLTC